MTTCPTCALPLPAGQSRCPACAASSLPVEGALAPDLSRRPQRGNVEPLREVPGKRRRERTWKDEVRERVDRRREVRVAPGAPALPLFPDGSNPQPANPALTAAPARSPAQARRAERRPAPATLPDPPARETGGPSVLDAPDGSLSDGAPELSLRAADTPAAAPAPLALDALDLRPLAAPDPRALLAEPLLALDDDVGVETAASPVDVAGSTAARLPPPRLQERPRAQPAALSLDDAPDDDWTLELPKATGDPRPLERPASMAERAQAALVDAGLLAGLAIVVVYFAGRVAQVPLAGLRPAWPMLCAYLAFMALVYASYFTGTTGQTIGKIMLGLRVVDSAGQAPGYGRAALRALLGSVGALLGGAGLATILFDPARRAVHDRLMRTRVVSLTHPS